MGTPTNTRRRWLWGLAATAATIVGVAGVALLAGLAAIEQRRVNRLPWQSPTTVYMDTIPSGATYAPIQPAIIPYMQNLQDGFDLLPVSYATGAMPLGVYVPRYGSDPYALDTPQPPPTESPVELDLGILTMAESADESQLLPYAGDGCAPRGLPAGGVFTQYFHAWHSGVDYGIPVGTPLLATHSGEVIFAGWSEIGYGKLVIVQNGAFITYYAHLDSFKVATGQRIGAGSVVGWSGNTGNSSGPHVHYEVRVNDIPVDPFTFENLGHPSC